MDEANGWDEEDETARALESGMAVRNDGCGVQPVADAEADVCANGTATCHHVDEGAGAARSGI